MLLSLSLALSLSGCEKASDPPAEEDPSLEPIEAYDPLALVDPFIATGGDGAQIANTNPGASVPFGMTHVGPDTRSSFGAPAFYHCAGYWYNDTHIHAFSHTPAHGMGVTDFGGVALMPVIGWDDAYTTQAGRMTAFSHDDESASPGRYEVTMGNGVAVQITATLHGGHTRVTWPAGSDPVLLVDLGPSIAATSVPEAWLSWTPGDPVLTGFQRLSGNYSGRFGGLRTSIEVVLDPAPSGGGAWDSPDAPTPDVYAASGTSAGTWLRFPAGTTTVDVRVALSYVDAEGAHSNLVAELPDADWDARAEEAATAWRERMEGVRVRGGTPDEQTIFHTALFHAALMPRRYDDVDGRYRGVDQEVHTTTHPYYSDLSLWDTFRTTHPFYVLAWPDVQLDVVRSLTRMTADGGAMPRWPLGHGYTGGMVGAPATQVIAESWLKGLTDFDVETAWHGLEMASDGTAPAVNRGGIQHYVDEGYVAVESGAGASNTLEYAWNDHAMALLTEALGKDATRFRERASSWRNTWYAEAGFFTGRCADPANPECAADGVADEFAWPGEEDTPIAWQEHYVEGNAWHYLWYVPFDTEAMIDLQHGGDRSAWKSRYATYWDNVYAEPDDIGTDDYYWHGNEPVMHVAFMGSLAGDPDLTADPARWILAHRYANDPAGLDGNDDAGTLSSWYLLASTGIFPVAGTLDVAIASPLWERVEIDRPEGTWVVRAPGASESVRYLRSLHSGDEELTSAVVQWGQLIGDELVFELGDTPGGWAHAR